MGTRRLPSALERARINAGLSLTEVADNLSRCTATIRRYETGQTKPPTHCLLAMAKLYDCTVDELTGEVSAADEAAIADGAWHAARFLRGVAGGDMDHAEAAWFAGRDAGVRVHIAMLLHLATIIAMDKDTTASALDTLDRIGGH